MNSRQRRKARRSGGEEFVGGFGPGPIRIWLGEDGNLHAGGRFDGPPIISVHEEPRKFYIIPTTNQEGQ